MALQLSGSVNLTGDITLTSGSVTLLTGSVNSDNLKYSKVYGDLQFNHVSGSRSYYAGVTTAYDALVDGFGSGNDGPYLVLYPRATGGAPIYATYTCINRNVRAVAYSMYTNIKTSDFPGPGSWDNGTGPTVGYVSLGKVSFTPSSTSFQAISNALTSAVAGDYTPYSADEWSVVTGGTLSTSPEIHDGGTLYKSNKCNVTLGPTAYSPTYFTFLMSIGAAFPTKTYKFRFELIIEDLGS